MSTSNATSEALGTQAKAAPAKAIAGAVLSHRQILTILGGLLLGMFLAALDQTIVSTSMPRIANDLHGLNIQAWVTTSYLITATITTPIYGKLGDNYGRKKLFMFAITVFILGSALCSFATSMYQLAAFRAFQGLGAGGLFTLVLAIIGDIVSPRERARYTGYFMAMFGTSSVLGPLIATPMAPRTLVNVNFPALAPAAVKGIRVVRQGLRDYGRLKIVQRTDTRGYDYYWFGLGPMIQTPGHDTDLEALADGYVAVTPLHLDLTHEASLATLAALYA